MPEDRKPAAGEAAAPASDLDLETELLLSCARQRSGEPPCPRVRQLVEQGPDWRRLLAEAARHRVTPLLVRGLSAAGWAVPAGVRAELESRYHASTRHSLLLTGELVELVERLAGRGIPALPYKGPALAGWLYDPFALRQFDDLDVLVRRQHLEPAIEMLVERGYQPVGWSADRPPATDRGHNLELRRGEVKLELHWRISFFSPLAVDDLWRRAGTMELAGRQVLRFDDRHLLTLLCVHGGKHFWQRLQWLCDVAELCRARADWDWQGVLDDARRVGGERMVALGLRLADGLVGAELPPQVVDRLRRRRDLDRLEAVARRHLLSPSAPSPPVDRYRFYLTLRERRRDQARYAVHLARGKLAPTDRDRQLLPLPRRLSFLHYAFRPLRLAAEYGSGWLPASRARRLAGRALALPLSEVRVLLRVAALVAALPVLQRLLPLPRLMRLLDSGVGSPSPTAESAMARSIYLTRGLLDLRLGVFRPNCMKQSLVLFHLLRRHGLPVTIHFGVQVEEGSLAGHSWLELAGEPIAEQADPYGSFSVIYSYPDPAGRP